MVAARRGLAGCGLGGDDGGSSTNSGDSGSTSGGDSGGRRGGLHAGDAGVDFVAEGAQGRSYYQVAQTVAAPKTLERELGALGAVRDNCRKVLLALDGEDAVRIDGIVKMNAIDWLLDFDFDALR